MNVAFIIDKFDVGGTQRQLILLANNLMTRNIGKVMVICLQREGPLAVEISRDIQIVNLRLTRIYGAEAFSQMLSLRTRLKEWRCDVIHSFLPSANIFGSLIGKLSGIPVIVSRRDIGIYHSKLWQRVEEKVAYHLAKSVVCVSNEVKDILLVREPALKNKTTVLPNAIDISRADEYARSVAVTLPVKEYMVTVGNIKPVKAYDFLMESLSDIEGNIVVVGTGEHRNAGKDLERMREIAESSGYKDKIFFVGHKDPPEIAAIVKHALFAIHPSYSEGMSNAILEYMVHGNAVVCRDLPANRELVTAGVNGFLFKKHSDFAEKVNLLWRNSDKRQEMAEEARRFVCNNHGVDSIMSRCINKYNEVIAQ
jgi:glycosyltransferase involved in cell wall biosynthesis